METSSGENWWGPPDTGVWYQLVPGNKQIIWLETQKRETVLKLGGAVVKVMVDSGQICADTGIAALGPARSMLLGKEVPGQEEAWGEGRLSGVHVGLIAEANKLRLYVRPCLWGTQLLVLPGMTICTNKAQRGSLRTKGSAVRNDRIA